MTFWIFRKDELAKTLKEEKLPAWMAVMEKLLAAQVKLAFRAGTDKNLSLTDSDESKN